MMGEGHCLTIEDEGGSFNLRVEAEGRSPVALVGNGGAIEGVGSGGGGEGK